MGRVVRGLSRVLRQPARVAGPDAGGSGLARVLEVYGADDPKGGAVRSCFEILSHPRLNHQVQISSGILAAECAAILQSFFAERR